MSKAKRLVDFIEQMHRSASRQVTSRPATEPDKKDPKVLKKSRHAPKEPSKMSDWEKRMMNVRH
jgi:hypothetical protein